MKNWIFIICLTILLKPVIPVFDYIVNYDYIRTELCENKETPIMGCNGKCYLMKNLAAASDAEKPASSDKKHAPVIETSDLFISAIADFEYLFAFSDSNPSFNSAYSNLYCNAHNGSYFHPPISLS
ncbi:hypothetical protein FNO01nite_32810 [Flavobacterium noncentrifugens]|uniref:Uncharacterized protein n=1 Tax=Flavobacterium noncentrifugens TaxID=1128970 RepID=A0A1G8UQP2_9FLAO|nr:hypothetical protein [Flavobacterium noncentrifugens]GEP52609.1 hypothetical protein FNO01nite_32810 [Flavobacterium noncentrifugens]SDJ56108.1 hypothetical protein SAMN04487935_1012 [Flavobacterium noncentrifugens]